MSEFKIRFMSRESAYQPELSKQIVHTPIIRDFCFPSFTHYGKYESPNEFNVNMEVESYNAEYPDSLSSMFTFHQEDRKRLWINLHKKPSVVPSIILINFTEREVSQDTFSTVTFKEFVSQLLPIFPADQITLYNTDILDYRDGIPSGKAPNGFSFALELGWASFFGERLMTALGYERFDNLKTCFHKERLLNGMLVILQEEPFDAHNEEHRKREQQALEELGLLAMKKKGI